MNSNDNNDIVSEFSREDKSKHKIYTLITVFSFVAALIIFVFLVGHYFNNFDKNAHVNLQRLIGFARVFKPAAILFLLAPIISMLDGDFAPIIEGSLIIGFFIMAGIFSQEIEKIELKYKKTEN